MKDDYSIANTAEHKLQQEVDRYLLRNLYKSIKYCEERELELTDTKCDGCPYSYEFDGKLYCGDHYLEPFKDFSTNTINLTKANIYYEIKCNTVIDH